MKIPKQPWQQNAFKYGNNIIAEKYISGREITVPVLGKLVYPIIEIKPTHDLYDYDYSWLQ